MCNRKRKVREGRRDRMGKRDRLRGRSRREKERWREVTSDIEIYGVRKVVKRRKEVIESKNLHGKERRREKYLLRERERNTYINRKGERESFCFCIFDFLFF